MENKKKKKPRASKKQAYLIASAVPYAPNIPYVPDLHGISYAPAVPYDTTMREEQDYEYELSLIADMERREAIERERKEMEVIEHAQKELREKQEHLEIRDTHIKNLLRRLKLGTATTEREKQYIALLEAWMDSDKLCIWLPDDFYEYINHYVRVPKDTMEYLSLLRSRKQYS